MELLRHTLATVAYRARAALREAPESFAAFSAGAGVKTPAQILAHMGDLYDWALTLARGKQAWHDSSPLPWAQEVDRFFAALAALDSHLSGPLPLACSPERLFQGPIADSLTHIGQLATLRRLASSPIQGENYFRAPISVPPPPTHNPTPESMRSVITEQDIPPAGDLHVAPGAIVTPSARDLAHQRGVHIIETQAELTIAIGADHGGFPLKQTLLPILAELGWRVRDVGVYEEKPADYPDIAHAVARLVADGAAALGIIVDGAGIGSSMAANKVPGIRAALCYDKDSARNSREHNHANVLTLGGRMLSASQAAGVLRTWLATPFGGGRHQNRIDKITEIERRYSNWTPTK